MMMMGETWAQLGSLIASVMFLWAMFDQYFPSHLRSSIMRYANKLVSFVYPYVQITFHEYTGEYLKRSEAYAAIETYLSTKSSSEAKNLKAVVVKDSSQPVQLSMDENEEVADIFEGVKLWWAVKKNTPRTQSFSFYPEMEEKRYYKLTFHKSHRDFVCKTYINHVLQEGKAITLKNRQRKLCTNNPSQNWNGYRSKKWSHVTFEHPTTFDTLAMESKKKEEIINDLIKFTQSKDYYAKIGKAWKRGYLLYGPPGTGKSSMIAAMANFLKYDIYDLELTTVKDNTELRKLLIETTSKSIIVIEDIDCSLDLTGQRKKKKEKEKDEDTKDPVSKITKEEEESGSKVTLSGLLNFIDGLWSASTAGERLIVFTTNYVEKLDPALIRRGRMDKHIELSYCGFEAFKVLAKNYLDVDSHQLFATIGQMLEETKMTPADVAENLMPKSLDEDAETCLENLIEAIKMAKEEAIKKAEEEARLKAEKEEKEKKDAAEKDVKVDESLAKEVKENGVEVVKDDKALAKEVKENGVTA
jgi:AAA+ superfamily predicted ATPase|uniref:AAA+ ATPase domain-containing protein n=1 Tax=Fagus sylvatica TaxID=28930 RepID=A0A2N9EKU3_FAGSY